jgi:hypothetical protein
LQPPPGGGLCYLVKEHQLAYDCTIAGSAPMRGFKGKTEMQKHHIFLCGLCAFA